jgi:hypothetical protein
LPADDNVSDGSPLFHALPSRTQQRPGPGGPGDLAEQDPKGEDVGGHARPPAAQPLRRGVVDRGLGQAVQRGGRRGQRVGGARAVVLEEEVRYLSARSEQLAVSLRLEDIYMVYLMVLYYIYIYILTTEAARSQLAVRGHKYGVCVRAHTCVCVCIS